MTKVIMGFFKKPDSSFRKLFYTKGSCVPKGLLMVDDRTAIVNIDEVQAAILDFAENSKFVLSVKV